MIKDLVATHSTSSPQLSHKRATPLTYKADASMSPQLTWPGLQLSDISPVGVEAEEALAWSPSMFLLSSPRDITPDVSHSSGPLHTMGVTSQQDDSTVSPFVLPSDFPPEHIVASEEVPAAGANSSDSAQTIDQGIEALSAAVPASPAQQRLTPERESLPSPESTNTAVAKAATAAVPEEAVVIKAAAGKKGRKAPSRRTLSFRCK